MNKDGSNPREEAVVRAHAWAVRLWNERKISADFTSDDEAELVEMLLGFLAVAPYPQPAEGADFAALKNDNYRLQSELADLRRQLAEAQAEADDLKARFADMAGTQRAAENNRIRALETVAQHVAAEAADLRRQLAECQEEIEKFEVLGIAAGADSPESPESILTAILRMQLPHDRA